MDKQTIGHAFELKAIEADGTFSGYASVFSVLDWYNDVIMKGAFKNSIEKHKANKTMPRMFWQHDHLSPIGVWTAMEEDDRGLMVEGRFIMEASQGRDAHALVKGGAINSMSIGYYAVDVEYNNDVRLIKEVDLVEISVVSFPANELALIQNVKTAMERGDLPAPKVFERLLRDAGCSTKQAKAFMAKGYSGLRDAGQIDADLAQQIINLAKQMKGE